jgi:hypothetical protein
MVQRKPLDGRRLAAYAGGREVAMRKRKLVAKLVVFSLVAAIILAPSPQPSRITRENFNRLKDGMSRAEVEAILGPPGDYRIRPVGIVQDGDPDADMSRACASVSRCVGDSSSRTELWKGDDWFIMATFSSTSGKVLHLLPMKTKNDPGPIDTLLWRAKRQWRKWFP